MHDRIMHDRIMHDRIMHDEIKGRGRPRLLSTKPEGETPKRPSAGALATLRMKERLRWHKDG